MLKPIEGLPPGAEVRPIGGQQQTPESEGFAHSLASSLGLTGMADTPKPQHMMRDAAINAVAPGATAVPGALKGIWEGAKRSGGELMQEGKAALSGDPAGMAYHGIKAIPIIGPGMDKMAEQAADNGMGKPGNSYGEDLKSAITSPGAIGTGLGTAAQGALAVEGGSGMAGREGFGAIPTTARAGKLFEQVMAKAKDQPVSISPETMAPLERTQQLAMTGGKPFTTADKLYQRIQTVNPLTYGEARDFASNMALSPEEKMGLKKSMKYEVPKMAKSFGEDVGRAAEDAGAGPDYQKAMKMYRRGSQIESAGKGLVKYGGRAALGAAGAGGLYEVGKALNK